MTGLLIETPPGDLTLAGRHPGMVVAGWVSRRAGRSGGRDARSNTNVLASQTFAVGASVCLVMSAECLEP